LGLPRSTAYYQPRPPAERRRRSRPSELPESFLVAIIYSIIQHYPIFGVRQTWAMLRHRLGIPLNRKRVARIMRQHRWGVRKRRKGGRPRVEVPRSLAERPNQRWAPDIALVRCGRDGWCAFVPVIDCCTREVLGWELSDSWRAKTAERALESALIGRFGYTRGAPEGLRLRHDNGLAFGSRRYVASVRDYRLTQEYIAPYTPQENGMCERFIRTMKEGFAWQHPWTVWTRRGRPCVRGSSGTTSEGRTRPWGIDRHASSPRRPPSPPLAMIRPKPPPELESS
jgi:putative transposase